MKHIGCYDAVASMLEVALDMDHYCKGVLSRKVNGTMNWTVAEIEAIEDFAKKFPITKYLAQRLPDSTDKSQIADCLIDQSGTISVEVGEAVQAILKAQKSESSDDSAKAIAEIQEAIEALQKAQNRLMAPKGE